MHKTFTTCLFCTLQSWPRSCSPAHAAPAVWLDCTCQRRSGSRVGETFRRVLLSWPCSIWSALRLPMTNRQENTLLRSPPRNSSLFPWYVLFEHNNLWLQKNYFIRDANFVQTYVLHIYICCVYVCVIIVAFMVEQCAFCSASHLRVHQSSVYK